MTVMCDMPEILMRMKISSLYSLKEMQEMFNQIMKKIDKKEGPIQPEACALYLYPEVFLKHRDEYIYSMLRKIADEGQITSQTNSPPLKTIDVYLGSFHVSPISRLWNTQTTILGTKDIKEKQQEGEDGGRGRKLALKGKKEKRSLENQIIDFDMIHQIDQKREELAEDKIEKQALMEALFGSQIWSEPYVRNPFIYVTDNDVDFSGDQGVHLKDHFKKVFYLNYTKYQSIIKKVVPHDIINDQFKRFQEEIAKTGHEIRRNA